MENSMNLIQNKRQFENFINNILPPLLDNEVYFVSLSARSKYLTEYERKFYGLGNTTMFARTLVRSKNDWPKAMRSLEGDLQTRLTKNGFLFPQKALVVYVNINPSDSVTAVLNFERQMTVEVSQMVKAQMRGKEANFLSFKRADRMLLDSFQTATGERTYLDIDMDTKDEKYLNAMRDELLGHGVEHYIIETHGGYHFLVKRATLNKSGYGFDLLVKELANDSGVEIMFNKNGMVSIPGTLHSGFLVKVL